MFWTLLVESSFVVEAVDLLIYKFVVVDMAVDLINFVSSIHFFVVFLVGNVGAVEECLPESFVELYTHHSVVVEFAQTINKNVYFSYRMK